MRKLLKVKKRLYKIKKKYVLGAMAALKSIFKEVEVPEPIDFFATKWGKEEFSQMSYSYVKIGASG